MPLTNPITVVVGNPIKVTKNENPKNEEIDALHLSYLEELNQLYEAHKSRYGQKHKNIEFV